MLIKDGSCVLDRQIFLSYLFLMVVEHYIAQLLYRYDCVVVPEFGAFLTQNNSAQINTHSNVIYPPSKTLSFNQQVSSNDGLLISHMAKAENLSYEEVLKRVLETANDWQTHLNDGKRLNLDAIGDLWFTADNTITFKPYDKVNYLTSSFGLSSIVSTPTVREVLKKEVVALEEKTPIVFTPEKREANSRSYLKYAAVFLLTIATAVAGYMIVNEDINTQQIAEDEARAQVSKHIQEATFFDHEPLELPALLLNFNKEKKKEVVPVATKNERLHHIVAGAFRFKNNANKKMRQLKRRGFEPKYIGTNAHGLHMIAYESYMNAAKAVKELKIIKQTQSKDAWLLSTK